MRSRRPSACRSSGTRPCASWRGKLKADARCYREPAQRAATCRTRRFMTVFASVIAITKDLPDIEGDRKYNVETFATVRERPIARPNSRPRESLPSAVGDARNLRLRAENGRRTNQQIRVRGAPHELRVGCCYCHAHRRWEIRVRCTWPRIHLECGSSLARRWRVQ